MHVHRQKWCLIPYNSFCKFVKIQFSRRNFHGLLAFAMPKDAMPQILRRKLFSTAQLLTISPSHRDCQTVMPTVLQQSSLWCVLKCYYLKKVCKRFKIYEIQDQWYSNNPCILIPRSTVWNRALTINKVPRVHLLMWKKVSLIPRPPPQLSSLAVRITRRRPG